MTISIIVAVAQDGVIGRNNKLIWRLPDDLKRFKALTTGHCVVMGRKTYESIGRPLPQRTNIVVSRNVAFVAEGCTVVQDLEGALACARATADEEVFVIGGGQIYQMTLALAQKMYVTEVKAAFEGDAFFPKIDLELWHETSRQAHATDDKHAVAFDFVTYERL